MAGLDAVNQVGESIVAMLRDRRNLLAAADRLGPVPAGLDIAQATSGQLATTPAPTAGLTLTCYHLGLSDHPAPRSPARSKPDGISVALEVGYLVAAWSATPAEEQGVLSWAMLELSRYSTFDRALLVGPPGTWEREETVQIVPETLDREDLFRIWGALQLKYRLSTTFRARVIRIGYGPGETWPPVVASRFGFADTDPMTTEDA